MSTASGLQSSPLCCCLGVSCLHLTLFPPEPRERSLMKIYALYFSCLFLAIGCGKEISEDFSNNAVPFVNDIGDAAIIDTASPINDVAIDTKNPPIPVEGLPPLWIPIRSSDSTLGYLHSAQAPTGDLVITTRINENGPQPDEIPKLTLGNAGTMVEGKGTLLARFSESGNLRWANFIDINASCRSLARSEETWLFCDVWRENTPFPLGDTTNSPNELWTAVYDNTGDHVRSFRPASAGLSILALQSTVDEQTLMILRGEPGVYSIGDPPQSVVVSEANRSVLILVALDVEGRLLWSREIGTSGHLWISHFHYNTNTQKILLAGELLHHTEGTVTLSVGEIDEAEYVVTTINVSRGGHGQNTWVASYSMTGALEASRLLSFNVFNDIGYSSDDTVSLASNRSMLAMIVPADEEPWLDHYASEIDPSYSPESDPSSTVVVFDDEFINGRIYNLSSEDFKYSFNNTHIQSDDDASIHFYGVSQTQLDLPTSRTISTIDIDPNSGATTTQRHFTADHHVEIISNFRRRDGSSGMLLINKQASQITYDDGLTRDIDSIDAVFLSFP